MAINPPPQWPGIHKPFAHKDLANHLFYVASLHARRALTGATDDLAILDRAMSVGASVELLAKSALAHINPGFLAADREPKHLLHFSGISTVDPSEAKTRMVGESLTVLQKIFPLDYIFNRDSHAFEVRNLAAHLGCVDAVKLDKALTTMVALSEQIITVISGLEPSLDRIGYWTDNFLEQVDERLKAQAQAKKIEIEQLKAAAQRDVDRLRARGLEDVTLAELADRPPPMYYEIDEPDLEGRFERLDCPVCGFQGWLRYAVHRGLVEYERGDGHGRPIPYVDVNYEPDEFYCNVCSLRLGEDLVAMAKMGEARFDTADATEAEVDAADQAAIDSYVDGD